MFESIKVLEIKTFMPFNLDFVNNTILSYNAILILSLLLFLNYWLILFNSCSYFTNFSPIVELAIPTGISTKEAKAEMKTHPVIAEITIKEWLV